MVVFEPLAREVVWIHVCSCVCPYARTSVTSFSWNLFISFFLKFCITEKSDRSRFARKILVRPKMCRKGAEWSFFEFSWHFVIIFRGSNLKWKKDITVLCFLVQPPCLGKFWFTSYMLKFSHTIRFQDSLIINILWNNNQFVWFFTWRYKPRKGSIWDYYFWLGVSSYAQPRLK